MSTHTFKISEEFVDDRLDVFLTESLEEAPSRNFVKKLIDGGHVKVNESVAKANHKLKIKDDVIVQVPEDFLTPKYIQPENIPLNIFYEDKQIIIVNKPNGLLVHPAQGIYTGTLVNALLNHALELSNFNDDMRRPGIVHRLDLETSGLMVIAKDNITHTKLAKQFQRHEVKKKYVALVEGLIEFDEGIINEPIMRHPRFRDKKIVGYEPSAKESKTFYRVLKRGQDKTLVALYPKTGRTHQLRVHMRFIKHPILGDSKYGKKSSFKRMALHAQALGFRHPLTKQFVEFVSCIPPEFKAAI